jgi:hypothetical protein
MTVTAGRAFPVVHVGSLALIHKGAGYIRI